MEKILERILARLDSMEQGQQQFTKRLDSMENRLGGIEGQLSETNQIARAIKHRTEELTAEVNNIGLTVAKLEGQIANTATKEDVVDLDSKFEVLNSRLFHQEAALYRLKAVE